MAGELTVSERILYHLNSYIKYEDKYEAPFDMTQDGVSQACGISRAHAAIELKKLKSSGIIEERLCHVRKGKTRRKVYFLTPQGKSRAAKVMQYIRDNNITPQVDASRISPDYSSSRMRPPRKPSTLPTVMQFFGRRTEMDQLVAALNSPTTKLLAIRGIAGIGKTTLAVRLCSDLRDQRIFWYSVKPWDSVRNIEDALAKFFMEAGCRRLASCLSSGRAELSELSYLLNEELAENGYVFVFDDADVSPALTGFMNMFRHSSGAAKIVITSECDSRFYDSADIVAKKEVFELELGGLDREASLQLLRQRGIEGSVAEELVRMTNGHPLSLEMVTATSSPEALHQVSRFLEEKFCSALTDDERSLLQFASVFEGPFAAEAIPREFRRARKGSMLRDVTPGMVEIHSALRDFVYRHMTKDDRARWHSVAADYFLRTGDVHNRLFHLIRAGRMLEAEMLVARSSDDLLTKGNIQRLWDMLSVFTPSKQRYRLRVQMVRAKAASLAGRYADAWEILEELRGAADERTDSEALCEMGRIRSKQGQLEEASKLFQEALDKSGDSPGDRAKALRGLGVVEGKLGNYDRALELLERSVSDAMAAVDQKGMLLAQMELGNIFIGRGLYREAISHFSKCAGGFGPVELASVYVNIGVAHAFLGELDDARTHLTNAVRLAEETGQPRVRAYALSSLAEVLIRTGQLEEAKERCFAALEILTELNDRLAISAAYANLGMAERVAGNPISSEEYYRESLRALEGMDVPRSIGMRKFEFALMLKEKGEPVAAEQLLREARSAFERLRADDLVARVDLELSR